MQAGKAGASEEDGGSALATQAGRELAQAKESSMDPAAMKAAAKGTALPCLCRAARQQPSTNTRLPLQP